MMRKVLLSVWLALIVAIAAPSAVRGQTLNLFNAAAVQSGGPYEPSGKMDNYGYDYELVPSQGKLKVVANWTIGANNAGNSQFVIVFFAADKSTVLGYQNSADGGTCIDASAYPQTAYYGISWNTGTNVTDSQKMINDGCTLASSYIAYVAPPLPAPTLTLAIGNHAYNDAPFSVTAVTNSTGALTYSASGVATVSGQTVTLTGANGTASITAHVAADANYSASSVTTSFTVTGAPTPITSAIYLPVIPTHKYTDAPFTVTATTNSSASIVYTITSGPATLAGNTLMLSGTTGGTVVVTASVPATSTPTPGYTAASTSASFTVGGPPLTGPQFVNITHINVTDVGGGLLLNGKECFTPVNNLEVPISASYSIGSVTGSINKQPVCPKISNGVLQAGFQLVKSNITQPLNLCYMITITNTDTGQIIQGPHDGYPCFQPTKDTELSTVPPNTPGLAVAITGPVGPAGPAGADGPAGAAGVPGALTQNGTSGGLFVNGPLSVNGIGEAAIWSALRYASADPQGQGRSEIACIFSAGDSINNGVGETEAADRPLHQLEANLVKAGYPMAGSGLNTILGYSGNGTMDWQVTGTITTSHEFGPYQTTGTPVDSLAVTTRGSAVTYTLVSPTELHYGGTTLNLLAVTEPGDNGIDVYVDHVQVGSAACMDNGTANNPTTTSTICKVTYGGLSNTDHQVDLKNTNNGQTHIFGIEWTGANSYGFLLENYNHGTTRSDSIASDTAHQLAFIPYLSCVPNAVIYDHGDNNLLQGIGTAASFLSDMQTFYAAMQTFAPAASWFVLDAAYMNPSVINSGGMTSQQMHDQSLAFAQQISARYFSLKDAGQSYTHQQVLGWNSGDSIHPSDKLGRFIGWVESSWMLRF